MQLNVMIRCCVFVVLQSGIAAAVDGAGPVVVEATMRTNYVDALPVPGQCHNSQ